MKTSPVLGSGNAYWALAAAATAKTRAAAERKPIFNLQNGGPDLGAFIWQPHLTGWVGCTPPATQDGPETRASSICMTNNWTHSFSAHVVSNLHFQLASANTRGKYIRGWLLKSDAFRDNKDKKRNFEDVYLLIYFIYVSKYIYIL